MPRANCGPSHLTQQGCTVDRTHARHRAACLLLDALLAGRGDLLREAIMREQDDRIRLLARSHVGNDRRQHVERIEKAKSRTE